MSIAQTAEDYHYQTRKQAQKQRKFKISDTVAIKINKVDKITLFTPICSWVKSSKLKRVDM